MPPLLRRLGLVVLLAGLAVGCGDPDTGDAPEPSGSPAASSEPTSGEASTEAGSTEAGSAEGPEPCELLDEARIELLAGQPLGPGRETEVGGALPACLWGSLGDVGVQAAAIPADLWARTLPDLVAQLEASGVLDDANEQKLQEAADLVASGATIPADEACGLFTQMVELNGMPPGSDTTVNLFPSREDIQGLTGQFCRDGRFGTVVLARPDLTGSDEEISRVEEALSVIAATR